MKIASVGSGRRGHLRSPGRAAAESAFGRARGLGVCETARCRFPCPYLITLVGFFIGIAFLGERLKANDIIALVLIISALIIGKFKS